MGVIKIIKMGAAADQAKQMVIEIEPESTPAEQKEKEEKFDKKLEKYGGTTGVIKRDGSIMNSKQTICRNYDESWLPYPFNPLINLDYCWRVNAAMFKHSFYVAFPITGTYFIWARMPQCWKYSIRTFPKLLFAIEYVGCVLLINSVNIVTSLMFDDYCKRHSPVYDIKDRDLRKLKGII